MKQEHHFEGFNERITLLTAPRRIQALTGTKITPTDHAAFTKLIDSESTLIEFDELCRYQKDLEETRVARAALEERLSGIRTDEKRLETVLASMDAGSRSLAKALFNWACVPATAACEFLISWATLPPAFDIPRDSVMGVSVALAPVIAFFAMKEPVDRLFNAAPKRVVHVFNGLLAAAILALAYFMALARNEITRVLAAILKGDLSVEFEGAVLDSFVLALSVVLVVIGAVFLSYGFRYGGAWLEGVKARWQLRGLRREEDKVAERVAQSRAREVELAVDAKGRARLVADLWRKQVLTDLARLKVCTPAPYQEVDEWCGPEASVINEVALQ